jgi:hypothetical protein
MRSLGIAPRARALALSTLALAFSLSVSRGAKAQPKEYGSFGEKGRLIVSADRFLTVLSYASRTETFTDNNGNQRVEREVTTSGPALSLLLGGNIPRENVHSIPRLSVDYTVIPQLTVGGSVALAFGLGGKQETTVGNQTRSVDAPNTTIFGIAPRVGYILNLNDSIAFWPRGGVAFYSVSESSDNGGNPEVTTRDTRSYWSLDLDPQFVFLPFAHVGVLAGPIVNIPLAGSLSHTTETAGRTDTTSTDSKTFQFGITAGLLVWF